MPQWDESERRILGELESELGTAELSAVLYEWVTATVHRISAVTVALGFWRAQMIEHGYSVQVAEASLPLILERLWLAPKQPFPTDEVLDMLSIRLDEEEDANDEEED